MMDMNLQKHQMTYQEAGKAFRTKADKKTIILCK